MTTKREKQEAELEAPAEGEVKVDDYPERPYLEAITDEHRKVLEEAHQLPKG